jgi:hypothetical protein
MSLLPANFSVFNAFRTQVRDILRDLPAHEPAPTPAPAATPAPPAPRASAAATTDPAPQANAFDGALQPGLPALGITEHTVVHGDTWWRYLDEAGVFDQIGRGSAARLVHAYLPGTPALDIRAFGTRPAQRADAV